MMGGIGALLTDGMGAPTTPSLTLSSNDTGTCMRIPRPHGHTQWGVALEPSHCERWVRAVQ